ncbi:carboxypeptidase [Favolaschia claudopus]|uniref:Carboxypeptidase n=1 Tax=Favolaschia claudopus TaxID=2862362 RepID=A0AAW0AI39_9AGAR
MRSPPSAMLLSWIVSLSLVSSVIGGQIPIVDGVYGGVGSTDAPQVETETLTPLATTPGALRLTLNSGVCETTPGVFQASGYGDLTSSKSIFFWYFPARNNPSRAPLSLWFNGGPGSSSMVGLLQELGPCRITNDSSSVKLNPFSWNTNANVLFIDQPVGVGFSHGTLSVETSVDAAKDVWTFLQIFLKDSHFSALAKNALALWTESYGGHYGPTFAAYFLSQNAAIAAGTVRGIPLKLKTLGVGNGLTVRPNLTIPGLPHLCRVEPIPPARLVFRSCECEYGVDDTDDWIIACDNGGSDSVCSDAQSYCNSNILSPLAGNFDVYYVPSGSNDPYLPDITSYLASVRTKIGAEVTWQETNLEVYSNFAATGDWMRTSLPDLEIVINSGVRVLIYAGDADYIMNFNGVEAMVTSLNTKFSAQFKAQKFAPYKVKGLLAGQFKNAGTFSYLRIYGAGHEVPAYKNGSLAVGQAAFQMFSQIMSNQDFEGFSHIICGFTSFFDASMVKEVELFRNFNRAAVSVPRSIFLVPNSEPGSQKNDGDGLVSPS